MKTTRSVAIVVLLALFPVSAVRAPVLVALQTHDQTPCDMTGSQVDLIKWAVTQGGLTLLLILVLASYRRDFFRKDDARQAEIVALREEKRKEVDAAKEEKRELQAVLRDNAAVMQAHAIAIQRNTDANAINTKAIETLSSDVRALSERRAYDRSDRRHD